MLTIEQLPGVPVQANVFYLSQPTLDSQDEGWYPWGALPKEGDVAVGNNALTSVNFILPGDCELYIEWIRLHSTISGWPNIMGVAVNLNRGGNYSLFNKPIRAELLCGGGYSQIQNFLSLYPWHISNQGGQGNLIADLTDKSGTTNTIQIAIGGRRREFRRGS